MERLKQVFASSGQNYGALVLDLHGNRLGPTALFQVCSISYALYFSFFYWRQATLKPGKLSDSFEHRCQLLKS